MSVSRCVYEGLDAGLQGLVYDGFALRLFLSSYNTLLQLAPQRILVLLA